MEDGGWRVEDGKGGKKRRWWRMEGGGWKMEGGGWERNRLKTKEEEERVRERPELLPGNLSPPSINPTVFLRHRAALRMKCSIGYSISSESPGGLEVFRDGK
ncbi:hypothetical protein EYF80_054970 [Liparis tanakae]|uniref:Uncharacterized protein n=1 Tax=Liparis tanakae TaxID=230148 RepID=A0A4Z2F2F5_9TELE|nr:hypothetical protein EYF80_054970 [Liparis tanakae]